MCGRWNAEIGSCQGSFLVGSTLIGSEGLFCAFVVLKRAEFLVDRCCCFGFGVDRVAEGAGEAEQVQLLGGNRLIGIKIERFNVQWRANKYIALLQFSFLNLQVDESIIRSIIELAAGGAFCGDVVVPPLFVEQAEFAKPMPFFAFPGFEILEF